VLRPLTELIRRHLFAAERVHGDDTTVPLLARGKTITARLWTPACAGAGSMCVTIGRLPGPTRRPRCSSTRAIAPAFGEAALRLTPSAQSGALRERRASRPASGRICRDPAGRCRRLSSGRAQRGPGAGFGDLYDGRRRPGPITEAACRSHSRRKFFELADSRKAPPAVEAVRRIDELFAIERTIDGMPATERLLVRGRESRPVVAALEQWMRAERARLSRHAEVAQAIDYMLKRWPAFTRFLDDGRICLGDNAAERALRGIALGRRAGLFAGSDRGGERAAAIYTLIATAKLNDINPQAWLADVLARIADHPASRLQELLPWNWKLLRAQPATA
jgi:transposase